MRKLVTGLAIAAVMALAPAQMLAAADNNVGVSQVQGSVTSNAGGTVRTLNNGDFVSTGNVITTSATARVTISANGCSYTINAGQSFTVPADICSIPGHIASTGGATPASIGGAVAGGPPVVGVIAVASILALGAGLTDDTTPASP